MHARAQAGALGKAWPLPSRAGRTGHFTPGSRARFGPSTNSDFYFIFEFFQFQESLQTSKIRRKL
jgi:hypothetical protein